MQFFDVPGEFKCGECKVTVYKARFYKDSKAIEWMCGLRHKTRVSLFVPRGY